MSVVIKNLKHISLTMYIYIYIYICIYISNFTQLQYFHHGTYQLMYIQKSTPGDEQ